MLTATRENKEPITTAPRANFAMPISAIDDTRQVRQHRKSTNAVSRAMTLGWPDDRTEVIMTISASLVPLATRVTVSNVSSPKSI